MAVRHFNAEALRQALEERGLKRKFFAQRCGITAEYLGKLLRQERFPMLPLVKLMALELGVDEYALLKAEKETA